MNFVIGEAVFIRTITYHSVGRIVNISDKFLTLEDASWIADSGRFHNALRDGTLSEVEPIIGSYRVNIDSIIDVCEWKHPLPREQK